MQVSPERLTADRRCDEKITVPQEAVGVSNRRMLGQETQVGATTAIGIFDRGGVGAGTGIADEVGRAVRLVMKSPEVDIVSAQEVRRSLVEAGDIRAEIAFQNDINALLATVDAFKTTPDPAPRENPVERLRVRFPWLRRRAA